MENRQRNVVNLSQFDKPRQLLSPGEVALLLKDCRDRLISAVEHVWGETRVQVENDLIDLAENSPILENRNLYYQAQGLLRNRNESLNAGLRRNFVVLVESRIRSTREAAAASVEITADLDLS
ncbi:MAG: hypothetical protein ACYC43_05380, partial [Burkholderiales bacterium]